MWVWAKMALAVTVMVLPGGFALLFGYAVFRALRTERLAARASGQEPHFSELLTHLHFKDLVREARQTF